MNGNFRKQGIILHLHLVDDIIYIWRCPDISNMMIFLIKWIFCHKHTLKNKRFLLLLFNYTFREHNGKFMGYYDVNVDM